MFNDCYDLETVFFEEGRAQGAIDARSRGNERGRADAAEDGRRIGMEIGFYAGCARALMLLASEHADAVDARCVAVHAEDYARRTQSLAVHHMTLELAHALDANAAAMAFDVGDVRLDEHIERLRSRFKVLQLRARNIMALPDAAQLSARAAAVRRRDSGASAGVDAAADAAALEAGDDEGGDDTRIDGGALLELRLEGAARAVRRPPLAPSADVLAAFRDSAALF